MPELLTVRDVADILKVSYETALMYVKQHDLAIQVGRQYRVPKDKLSAHLNKQIPTSVTPVKLKRAR